MTQKNQKIPAILKILAIITLFISLWQLPVFSQSAQTLINAEGFINDPNLPFDSTATADDITSMYFNPAGIGIHPLQIGYFYGENTQDSLVDHVAFINLFGLAFSSQWRYAAAGFNAQRHTVGTGLETNNLLSLGISYSWYKSNISALDNFSQLDLGLILRPHRRISFGAVGRGINAPIFEEERITPSLDLGVALRPLPSKVEALTFSIDGTFSFENPQLDIIPRYSIELIPSPGLTFYGGLTNNEDSFFGIKFAQNITQLSYQQSTPANTGGFKSGGILISQERFKTSYEAIQRYLHISLDQPFTEAKKDRFLFIPENITFYEILKSIEEAANDPQITGLVITGRNFPGGWAQAEELRSAIERFKVNSQKSVHAFLEIGANKEYFIVSAADTISMPPGGSLRLNGLSAEVYYFKDLFELVGVQADYIRVGKYKSAPNTYTRSGPDKAEKEQMEALLENLSAELIQGIITGRKDLTEKEVQEALNHGYFTPMEAKKSGLIDNVQYFTDLEQSIVQNRITELGWKIDLHSYLRSNIYDDTWAPKPTVALLSLEGQITSTESRGLGQSKSQISSDNASIVIRNLAADKNVKAVVIRIDSPGGSSLASDILWKEIRLLQDEKPVIVSLGDYAASGGYYLAVGADEIIANRSTITGSIGVYSGKMSLKDVYEKLGIKKEVYTTHDRGAIFSETNRFSDEERKLIQAHMMEFYELFIDRVQRSRTNLSHDQIVDNSDGRVYTGSEAIQRGMVDRLGGLSLAIELAIAKAGLSESHVEVIQFSDSRKDLFQISPQMPLIPADIRKAIEIMSTMDQRLNSDEVYFIMPYVFEVK